MFYLALSCLQGDRQLSAIKELMTLEGVDGIQLTPGNAPEPDDLIDHLWNNQINYSTHNGFSFTDMRQRVWSGGDLVDGSDSVHPPKDRDQTKWFLPKVEDGAFSGDCLEVMYPGYYLSGDAHLEAAMTSCVPLAIDTSHLNIQAHAGVLSTRVLNKLLEYSHIQEVHVSHNNGLADSHQPLEEDSYLLDWARARHRSGTLLVYEGYLHRLNQDERQRQVSLVLN